MICKYSDIKEVLDFTKWDDKIFTRKDQPRSTEYIAHFTPKEANWSYRLCIAKGRDHKVYKVVTVFGEVHGYVPLWLAEDGEEVYAL